MSRSTAGRLCLVVGVLIVLSADVRTAPSFTGLVPASGAPRTVVRIADPDYDSGSVIWDAGSETPTTLPTNLNGTLFSVPADATPGTYDVVVENGSGRSMAFTFTVAGGALPITGPRIDDVMPIETVDDDGFVVTALYVQGANFDIGAVVRINGQPVATVAHKALTNNLYDVPPDALGYPIFHYVSLVAIPAPLQSGSEVTITVENLNPAERDEFAWTVPSSAASLDSDGDSMGDGIEADGYDADADGTVDTDPFRKDVFVELDIMPGIEFRPDTSGALDAVTKMFAAAPFLAPFSDEGIHLVFDTSGTTAPYPLVIFDDPDWKGNPPSPPDSVGFSKLKADHFDHKNQGGFFHYIIWAPKIGAGSGESDGAPYASAGDDAVVGLDSLGVTYQTVRSQAEVLAHELGHNLGQRHGGVDNEPFNPIYWSVMSYTWALRTGEPNDGWRRAWVTCLPFYYAKPGAVEILHAPPAPATVNLTIDYSAGMGRKIMEGPLDENTGVCHQPADWDEDGGIDVVLETNAIDANDNMSKTDTIEDFANWRSLRYNGPAVNGTIIP